MSVFLRTEPATPGSPPPAAERSRARAPWLGIDWREHQRWISVDGEAVNVIDLGPGAPPASGSDGAHGRSSPQDAAQESPVGEPLVFVHGLSGSWPNWLEQLPVFAAEHRVVALDLPGFGHSPMPSKEITISGYARLLNRLFDELGLGAAAVVGNSMGGFIGAELAIAFPQRVERLVLVSAAGISTYRDPRTQRAIPVLRRVGRVTAASAAWVASKSDAVALRPRLREVTLNLVVAHPSALPATLAAEQLRGAGKPGFIQALQAVIDYDVRERLPEIACPTLIVWGEHDRLISVRDADVFADLIPNSRKVLFPDTGHMAMLERPDEFNALLSDFLGE